MKKVKLFKEGEGIKIKRIHCFLMLCSCFLCLLIFFTLVNARSSYKQIISTINDYTECDKAINQFRNASDFLSNEARLYIINQDESFIKNYFQELKVLRQREKSIEILELSHLDDNPDIKMKMAFNESQFLRNVEIYSFKLVQDAFKVQDVDILNDLKNVTISSEDSLLSEKQKIDKAKMILFNSDYLNSRERITNYTTESLNSLVFNYVREENDGNDSISNFYFVSIFGILCIFICGILVFIIVVVLVLNPLYKQIKNIELGKRMDVKGSYEIKYIAKTYNALIEKNEINTSVLKHKAEHDSLTGLINRDAFETIKQIMMDCTEPIAYLILDIDFFKKINDTKGHLVGDEVLKKIANLLKDKFRDTDYIARIGGDEFAIIMTKFGQNPEQIIQSKIDILNKTLQNLSDGLPSVSLSVGVSFSSCGFIKELETQADKALYRVKNGGRCNCSFYDNQLSDLIE